MGEPEAEDAVDPFSDLFFTLAALCLLAAWLVASAARAPQTPSSDTAAAPDNALTLTASAIGVAAGSGGAIPLAQILSDRGLRESIRAALASGRPIFVVVEPDGQEAAFELDSLLAGAAISQVRLARGGQRARP